MRKAIALLLLTSVACTSPLRKAENAYKEGHYEEAEQWIRQIGHMEDDYVDGLYLQDSIDIKLGRIDRAAYMRQDSINSVKAQRYIDSIDASYTRKSNMDALLSDVDGSLPTLVTYVKKQMENPNSFEHVETGWMDKGDFLQVRMIYRGENMYGAIVTNTIVAECSRSGKVLRVIEN
jgi:hypothetical protein